MKSKARIILVALCVVVLVSSVSTAQDLAIQLSKMARNAAERYVTPISQGMLANINSAFYHSADLHNILGFDVGIKVFAARMRDDDKTYSLTLPTTIKLSSIPGITIPSGGYVELTQANYPNTVKANSAVGPKDATIVKTTGGTAIVYNSNGVSQGAVTIPANQTVLAIPGGLDLSVVPLFVPQAAIGLPFGIEVMGRYMPPTKGSNAGKVGFTGFGLRYDIDQWLPLFPVDIAVHFMTQKINLKSSDDKEVLSASGTAYGIELSKRLFILTLYGGFQLEKGKLTFNDYNGTNLSDGSTIHIKGLEIEGKNKSRVTVGARLLLLIANVHVEYSIAETPVIAAGVGISIR